MVVLYVFGVIVVIDVMVWLSRWMEQRCQSAFSLSDVVIPWNLTFVFLFMSVDVIWVPTECASTTHVFFSQHDFLSRVTGSGLPPTNDSEMNADGYACRD